MSLGIHILGPGFGESVVIECPDGSVGVVDVFADSRGACPVLNFLRSRQVESLAFLAVTHPHADHCTGMDALLKAIPVERFWLFDTFQDIKLGQFLEALYIKDSLDLVEQALELKPGAVFSQLHVLGRYAREAREQGRRQRNKAYDKFKYLRGSTNKFSHGDGLTIQFLTPQDKALSDYRDILEDSAKNYIADASGRLISFNPEWKPPHLKHNLISGSILLEYGKTRILLMGDAEKTLWQEFLGTGGTIPPVQLIKVAHHGSPNGYLSDLYETMCAAGEPIAVITPFDRHRFPLPTQDGIAGLKTHTSEIFCTNRSAAENSSKLTWEQTAKPFDELRQGEGLALEDLDLLRREFHPEWLRYTTLAGLDLSVSPDEALPSDFVALLTRAPSLLGILHPTFRNRHVAGSRPSLADEFRVSFYFDEDGKEDLAKRYLGRGTGKLQAR